ncbi:MAG: hypothetical protein A2161_09160 [Candidatus Schekmanbacteria bacterium RBG_13_48_7]|uniref:Uncharacterized protein n=1 Tax=Candidatus Schekmanbacteria bacterium RBG_13_48_7 TaxID=1817878 RepID=A0A1F7S0Y4_9BACT|nr:MAG: hypothetical protein A2161_09160 [Candidatus Schekmanbacteria bacterium RBG_13_48_7]
MDVELAYTKDVITLEGTGTSRVVYPFDIGYYCIRNNSNQEIEIHIKDVGISTNDNGILVPPKSGKILPKINKETKVFIEGLTGDTVDIYHSSSKFPDTFLDDNYNTISKGFFAWDGTEINNVAEHYIGGAYKLIIDFFAIYGRYAREIHIYEPSVNVRVKIELKDDGAYKDDSTALTRNFIIPAGASLNLPDKVELMIEKITIEASAGGTTTFNPYILIW